MNVEGKNLQQQWQRREHMAKRYKLWLLIDINGLFVVRFYPDCLIECLESHRCTKVCFTEIQPLPPARWLQRDFETFAE
ncbi:hypothetical protein T265_11137 [Opisthorchis viverrini]|uniref:Uncharacterized protein n=1 Tax=Opisthorchis viverrini TaxID=6198 RepID=A0A074ZAM6_OPIVI|nr:hypothetical protein T265_11137 [Opisthorchis viverrini]KER20275.1 hypothetical protein T265_11137 [Opisthorchis viverrini]